jgi:hypothetical protein
VGLSCHSVHLAPNSVLATAKVIGSKLNPTLKLFRQIACELGYRCWYGKWLQAARQRGQNSTPANVKNFLFSASSKPALRPTKPPIQCVLGSLLPGVKRLWYGVKLTTHLKLVPRSRKNGSIHPLRHTSSWRSS